MEGKSERKKWEERGRHVPVAGRVTAGSGMRELFVSFTNLSRPRPSCHARYYPDCSIGQLEGFIPEFAKERSSNRQASIQLSEKRLKHSFFQGHGACLLSY